MTTVLVSGASGIVGYGILRSLRAAGCATHLVGASIHAVSAASHFCDSFELAPRTDAPGYLGWLVALIRRRRIDLVIPGIEADLHRWVEYRPAIEAAGAKAALNDDALIRLCGDKWAFVQRLAAAGLDCAIASSLEADFDALAARIGRPFIVKPRRGYGSRGVRSIADRADFDTVRAAMGAALLAQQQVGCNDEEYTVAAFGDGNGGHGTVMAMRRSLSAEGFTEAAEVVAPGPFEESVAALCELLHPVGPTNFQFRFDGDRPKLLEINPRISSSTSIRAAFGYNEAEMAVEYHLHGRWPAPSRLRGGRAVRYTDELISYDDCFHR